MVTLNHVYFGIISHKVVAFGANCVKLTEALLTVFATEMQLKDSSFWCYMIHNCRCSLLKS